MSGALLVAGTTSDAGKSVVTAGICRWLARQGVRVAPFKAQNMSNNSYVTATGAEIGRAQAMQAAAARVAPEPAMNPVLLKPGSDLRSHLVLLGQPAGELDARSYFDTAAARSRREIVLGCLADLRARHDVVICEGAGSPAEINLRDRDIVNMGLARAAGLPVLLVGDIDRGGFFASCYGTLALLERADQELVAGFVVNKFRGDPGLLRPGLDMLTGLTGRPVMGVLPWRARLWLDAEDAPDPAGYRDAAEPPAGREVLRVAVVRLPRMSNFTDVDALASEPGVLVRFATRPEELADADLVVLPGTRATVADLAWLRSAGLAGALVQRAAEARPVLGICGGYQMLGECVDDEVESRAGQVPGLGLLPVRTEFATDKRVGQVSGSAYGQAVTGYEIHHGVVRVEGGEPFLDGCRACSVWGTTWHGVLENDEFRRAFLTDVAAVSGRDFVPATDVCFTGLREARLDALGDLVAEHMDTAALWRLITDGAPSGLPLVAPGGYAPR